MRKNIIISNFKKIPAAILITAVLVLATEWFLYANRPALINDYWNKFLINEHELIDMKKDYPCLIMGDSVQKTGIDPSLISEDILNLGLPGAKPMGQYLMLKRYLEKHKPPKVIFLYADPENPRDSLFVILRYFVNVPEFISIWGDLTWEERRVFIMRYWVSLDERKVALVKRPGYPESNETFVAAMKKNQGYMPSPASEKAIGDDYFKEHKERYQSGFSFSARDMKYLHKFIKLASSKNIKVVFLGFLAPKELHDILEESGFNADYFFFIKVLKRIYPNALFANNPIFYLDNKYFGDMSHLNKEGSKVYTEYLKKLFYEFKKGRAI